jgi:Domain of unknown function (DUF5666)
MTIRTVRRTFTAVTGVALALTLAACGSSSSGGSSSAAPSQAPTASNGQGAGRGGGPAAAGTVASVASSSLEVQSTNSGQVTVNFSGNTTFTNRVSATLADVTTGSCVIVTGTGTPVTARSVDVSAASSTGCNAAGGGGMRPQNGGSGRPSRPSGANNPGGGGQGGRTTGKVTAVSGTGFTVQRDNPQTGATTDVQVTVDGSTTYTKAESASASALKVGECVTANGQADSTGAVTATTIAISQAGPNGCTVGGGRQGNGGANG